MVSGYSVAGRVNCNHKTEEAQWRAVLNRDPRADGQFFYSVQTTGIYCRPSCRSRLPNRCNVRFHRNADIAERQGFRPCKRCQPDRGSRHEILVARIIQACRRIEVAHEPHSCDSLAAKAGMSRYHFQRTFKSIIGLTPKAYALECRARRVVGLLQQSSTITEALYEAGYNSPARFYAEAERILGMRPRDYVNGGDGVSGHYVVTHGLLGDILVAITKYGVCALEIGEDASALLRDVQDRLWNAGLAPGNRGLLTWIASVVARADKAIAARNLPVDIKEIIFRCRLRRILDEAISVNSDVPALALPLPENSPRGVRVPA